MFCLPEALIVERSFWLRLLLPISLKQTRPTLTSFITLNLVSSPTLAANTLASRQWILMYYCRTTTT